MEASVQTTTKSGFSLLHCAAGGGHVEVAQLLIDKYNADLTALDEVSVCVILQGVLQCALGPVVGCVLCNRKNNGWSKPSLTRSQYLGHAMQSGLFDCYYIATDPLTQDRLQIDRDTLLVSMLSISDSTRLKTPFDL